MRVTRARRVRCNARRPRREPGRARRAHRRRGGKPVGTLNRLTSPFAKHAYEAALALDCELYHLHDPELLPYALKLKRHGKTVIFDSHEFYSLLIQEKGYIPGFLKKPASRIYGALEAGVFKKLDAVIIPCTSFGKTRLRSAPSAL